VRGDADQDEDGQQDQQGRGKAAERAWPKDHDLRWQWRAGLDDSPNRTSSDDDHHAHRSLDCLP